MDAYCDKLKSTETLLNENMKIKELQDMARNMVGDGKSPALYFVTTKNQGTILVTRNFRSAYDLWRRLASTEKNNWPCLEDRKQGTICSCEPENDDGSGKVTTFEDAAEYRRHYRNAA